MKGHRMKLLKFLPTRKMQKCPLSFHSASVTQHFTTQNTFKSLFTNSQHSRPADTEGPVQRQNQQEKREPTWCPELLNNVMGTKITIYRSSERNKQPGTALKAPKIEKLNVDQNVDSGQWSDSMIPNPQVSVGSKKKKPKKKHHQTIIVFLLSPGRVGDFLASVCVCRGQLSVLGG